MKKLSCCLLLIIFFGASCLAASLSDTLKIYYQIDRKEPASTLLLDSLAKRVDLLPDIQVVGYADFLGTAEYNKVLAFHRAELVKQYLQTKIYGAKITASGKGQVIGLVKSGLLGDSLYRRVDIIYVLKQPIPLVADSLVRHEPPVEPIKRATVEADEPNIPAKQKINNLSKLNVGQAISLDEITFQPGRHYLREQAIPYLLDVLQVLKRHKNLRIEIQGHICCETGGRDGMDIDEGTVDLSVNRARFIYEYFIKKGIKPERLSYAGFGSSQPKVFPERNPLDQIKNRRVVFVVVGK